jgi:hypothetical protein
VIGLDARAAQILLDQPGVAVVVLDQNALG